MKKQKQLTYKELIKELQKKGLIKIKNISPYSGGFQYAVCDNYFDIIFRKELEGISYLWSEAYNKIFTI